MFIICIAIIAIILAGSAVTAVLTMNRNNTTAPTQMLNLGDMFLLELDFEQALVQFHGVIEIEPNNIQAHLGAAAAYVGLGQDDLAVTILRQGLERTGDEDIAWAWIEIGETAGQDVSWIFITIADILIDFGNTPLAVRILTVGLELTGSEDIRDRLIEPGAYELTAESESTLANDPAPTLEVQPTERVLGQGEFIFEVTETMSYMVYLVDGVPQPMGIITQFSAYLQREITTDVMAYSSQRASENSPWSDWRAVPHYWAGLNCTDCGEIIPGGEMPDWFRYAFSHPWSGEWRGSPRIFHEERE